MEEIDAESREAVEAAINLIDRTLGVLTTKQLHRRIVDAIRSLTIARSRLEDYLGR